MGMQRRTGSPGSEGSTSTAMQPFPGQHMLAPSLYGAAADWTPKKGSVAASLADSRQALSASSPRTPAAGQIWRRTRQERPLQTGMAAHSQKVGGQTEATLAAG